MATKRRAHLPASIEIGPFRYSVETSPGDNMLSVGEWSGRTSNTHLTITLLEGMPRDAEAEVMLHEVLHAAMNVAGKPLSTDDEEAAVRAISAPLLHALRENPELVAYLTEKEGGVNG